MQRSNGVNKREEQFEFGKSCPYQRNRKHSKFDLGGEDLTVIPVEIELDTYTYEFRPRNTRTHICCW